MAMGLFFLIFIINFAPEYQLITNLFPTMKTKLLLLTAFLMLTLGGKAQTSVRETIRLDEGWKFAFTFAPPSLVQVTGVQHGSGALRSKCVNLPSSNIPVFDRSY